MEINDLVVVKSRMVSSSIVIPNMGLGLVSMQDEPVWGVFRINPYTHSMKSPVETSYKVVLTPVGKFANYFVKRSYYCSDIFNTKIHKNIKFYHFKSDELEKAEDKVKELNNQL